MLSLLLLVALGVPTTTAFPTAIDIEGADSASVLDPTLSARADAPAGCRCMPIDSCWPSDDEWAQFNSSIQGRLIKTVPLAGSCHYDSFAAYDAEQCTALQAGWTVPETHYTTSSSIMAPYFANQSCDPFLPPDARCEIGTYVSYAVDVSEPQHVSEALAFAAEKNIRVVIRNTGHDYNGKSTGAGALGIWVHNLKSLEMLDYDCNGYVGKAVKMGAGVQGFEAYEFVNATGNVIVGPEVASVGMAGGYVQAAGHSPLSSKFGLAADQVLEWEVVDGQGRLLRASPDENSDLYWALSGGGGGTFGVVLSATSRIYDDGPTSGANLTLQRGDLSDNEYYDAFQTYQSVVSALVDAQAVSVAYLMSSVFIISPITAPGLSSSQLRSILSPFTDKLTSIGANFTSTFRDFPRFLDQYHEMNLPVGVGLVQIGGRWIPRSLVETNASAVIAAARAINSGGGMVTGISMNTTKRTSFDNAVNPAWRTNLIDTTVSLPYNFTAPLSDIVADQETITNSFLPRLEAITPGGGAYLNEGDFRQSDFQQVFYGDNYARLLQVKQQYDPQDLFWAMTAVGSESWVVQPDGRLCRA